MSDEGGAVAAEGKVAIVGGGMAGLVAARELRRGGHEPIVLEARDRLGGRIWTSEGLGFRIEMGGTWVHWVQAHTWAELSRYGLSIVARPAPQRMGVLRGGEVTWFDPEVFAELVGPGQSRFLEDSREVFPRPLEPFLNRDRVAALDAQSVTDRLAELAMSAPERELQEALWSVHFNAPAADGALTQALRWGALGGWDADRLLEAAAKFKLRDGMSALVDAVAADAGDDVRLGTPVERIVTEGDGVTVHVRDGAPVAAAAAIVTLPINVLEEIDFEPALPGPLRRLAEEKQASRGSKLFIRVSGQFEPTLGVAPLPHPVNHFRTEFWDEDATVIVAYNFDGSLDIDDTEAVEKALAAWIPGVRVEGTAGHDWTEDPFSRQTWGMLRPGQLSGCIEAAHKEDGRLVFAGSDLAAGWAGFIDGAIESGMVAARRVDQLLRG